MLELYVTNAFIIVVCYTKSDESKVLG